MCRNIFFLWPTPRRTCDKLLNNDPSINGVEIHEINSFIVEVSILLLRACVCMYVLRGMPLTGMIFFILRVSRHVCRQDWRVYVKNGKFNVSLSMRSVSICREKNLVEISKRIIERVEGHRHSGTAHTMRGVYNNIYI